MRQLCTCMYVSEPYQRYIPLYVYFYGLAYPEYALSICTKEALREDIRQQINIAKCEVERPENVWLHEKLFETYPNDPDTVKMIRWGMELIEYHDFEYIYIGDIDILTIKEDVPLLEQHKRVMEESGLPYSNTCNIDDIATRGHRMTGLHCFKAREYLAYMHQIMIDMMRNLKEGITNANYYNVALKKIDNQKALYKMIEKSGMGMPTHKFFSYHGLHLGHSRCQDRWEDLFQTDALQREYYKKFATISKTKPFRKLYESADLVVQQELDVMIQAGEKFKCLI